MLARYALNTVLVAVALIYCPSTSAQAQSFTRVTTGPVATHSDNSLDVAWGDYDDDGRIVGAPAGERRVERLLHFLAVHGGDFSP